MQVAMVSTRRQRVTAVLLKLLAVGFGLCTLPFLGEGLENLLMGNVLWPLECFAMALVPATIAHGLWQRRRWVRTAALGISVLAIPLLPLLTIANAIFSYSADVTDLALALFLGLFAALIVFFLTSPETKALFGVTSENASRRRPMIPRAVLGTVLLAALVIVGGAAAVSIVSKAGRQRQQAAIDERVNERIGGELKPLIEEELRSMGDEAFVRRHCGAFQSLDRVRVARGRSLEGLSSIELHGIARFENADLNLRVNISFADMPEGQASVELRFWPDENWLKAHPKPNVRNVDRQLEVSADLGRESESTFDRGTNAARVVHTTSYARIEGSATCPTVLFSN